MNKNVDVIGIIRNSGLLFDASEELLSTSGVRYKTIRCLGAGKNNIVYYVLATSGEYKGQFFSVKIQYNLQDRRIKRFFREIAFLKQQNSELILKYIDEGYFKSESGTIFPFVVVPYVPYTLEDYMDEFELSIEKKVRFCCQLLSALKVLQRQNVLHRDLKPQNILTNGENIVIGDFGLVKNLNKETLMLENDEVDVGFMDDSVSMPRYYRTPELVKYARGEDVLHIESDVFQMGLVFFEIFADYNPLLPADSKLTELVLRMDKSVFGEERVCNFKEKILQLIMAMLKFDYSERATVDELLNEFLMLYQDVCLKGAA